MRKTIITKIAGPSAVALFIAVIATSCGSEAGDPSASTALLPGTVSSIASISALLTGSQHVPPVATAGTGSAVLTVNLATGELSGTVSFSGLSSAATAAHIHEGATGLNGPIVIPLTGGVGVTSGTTMVPGGIVMTAVQINALRIGALYVQIHTVLFPGGELRGQLMIP